MTSEPALIDALSSHTQVDLEALASVALVLEEGITCPTLERIFGELEQLTTVVVRDAQGTRFGVVSRRDFELVMGGRFGYGRSLNHRRPVGELADWGVQVLPAGSGVVAAAGAAVARAGEHRFDDLLLQGADGVLRVLPAGVVLEALAADYARRATRDALTGLVNRDLLFGHLAEALAAREGSDVIVLSYVDVVGLKPINRQYGHDAGDAVLVRVADALRGAAGADDVVARVGGDEFAVLAVICGAEGAAVVAEDHADGLIAAVRDAFAEDVVPVRASVGTVLARPRQDGVDATEVLRQATVAMYTAQRWGSAEAEVVQLGAPVPS